MAKKSSLREMVEARAVGYLVFLTGNNAWLHGPHHNTPARKSKTPTANKIPAEKPLHRANPACVARLFRGARDGAVAR